MFILAYGVAKAKSSLFSLCSVSDRCQFVNCYKWTAEVRPPRAHMESGDKKKVSPIE
jgi:hypothetical protein